MRVLLIPDTYFPRLGGAEVYAYKLATFLKKKGHEVSLLTPEEGESGHDTEFPVYRLQFSKNILTLLPALVRYYQLVRDHDVVHAVYAHKMALLGGVLAFILNKKLVITEEGKGGLSIPGNTWFLARVHEFYSSMSIKLSFRYIASCREFVDVAKRYTKKHNKITYQPNGVDVGEFKPIDRDFALLPFKYENEPLIFIVRRMVPKNGVQFLVEAMPSIVAQVPNAKVVHIGWGKMDEYLKRRVEELGVKENFFFLGRVKNDILKHYLNLADIVVFPSTAEATSIACLESMAMGKAIVASKVGGFPEMVEHGNNGYLVNLTDTELSDYDAPMTLPNDKLRELADAIIELVADKKKRMRFGACSRERAVSEFSWQRNINQIIKWYNTSP